MVQAQTEENITSTPKYFLPEDNGPMLAFSDHVSAFKTALNLEQIFWFTQFCSAALQITKLVQTMVSQLALPLRLARK